MYFFGKHEAHKIVFKGKLTLEGGYRFSFQNKIFVDTFSKKPKLNYFPLSFMKTKNIMALELSSKRESDSQKVGKLENKQTSRT